MSYPTLEQFMTCTGANRARAEAGLAGGVRAMALYDINTPARIGMFLANVGHETGGLKWLREIWGPTEAQRRYEGRRDLGNTQPGDGKRYMGRGWLQTTGRANYEQLTRRLMLTMPPTAVPDFVASPELLELPEWAPLSAADYVAMRGLNAIADTGDFVRYVRAVNGGTNGLEHRQQLWEAAQCALGP